jgi:hypothetical protein
MRPVYPYKEQAIPGARRMVKWCQGAWSSMREFFALLDDAVGGALYLIGNEDSTSEANVV